MKYVEICNEHFVIVYFKTSQNKDFVLALAAKFSDSDLDTKGGQGREKGYQTRPPTENIQKFDYKNEIKLDNSRPSFEFLPK